MLYPFCWGHLCGAEFSSRLNIDRSSHKAPSAALNQRECAYKHELDSLEAPSSPFLAVMVLGRLGPRFDRREPYHFLSRLNRVKSPIA